MAQAIVFYISGHGFGHASRSIEVINAILAQRPETRVGVRTSAPRWLFDLTVKGRSPTARSNATPASCRSDALTLDEADSIRRAAAFHSDLVTRAASETRSLRELGAGLIVGDIPPLAFAVGASAGIPSIGLGNFTWDWIYADYPRVRLAPSLLPAIRGAYAKASMALRLPMSGGFESFSNVKDIPFIARHATPNARRGLQAAQDPGGQADRARPRSAATGCRSSTPTCSAKFKKYTVVVTTDGAAGRATQGHAGRRTQGLVRQRSTKRRCTTSACATRISSAPPRPSSPSPATASSPSASPTTPRCSTRRAATSPSTTCSSRRCRSICARRFINHDDLFAGKWESHLDKLLAQPKPKKKPETNGADVAADILLKALDKPPKKPRGRPKVKI